MTAGTVARIAIAPVKALGLVHPDTVSVSRTGVAADRRYVILDAQHRLANGKRLGPLVRIRPEIGDDPETLVLHLPDGRTVGGPVELGDSVEAIFYGAERGARIVLGAYAEALSDAAGQRLTLVRMTDDGAGVDRADEGGSVSIQSSGALRSMAAAAGLAEPVDGRRFRMTFTVDGVEAHAEDTWIGCPVRVGEAVVRPGGNIGRCAVTTQDPDTGIRSLDTLRLLAETRRDVLATEPLPFGVWAEVLVPGRVRVGDPVEALPAAWTAG
ncbi:MAG TPA: MOSC N-terminal beta barrel domain-containing protein [Candidatus Limnocylindrales bacterium]|nr:MOSC N-terminal beta barrel domain-containing protein [Candidatus Limnocylindrales bacterium]